jgi:hypothetical protein
MSRRFSMNSRIWVVCVACVFAVGIYGCCNGDNGGDSEGGIDIGAADHWLVIHDKVGPSNTPWDICAPPSENDDVGFLPNCLDIEKGDTVGIANYSATDVTVNHYNSLDAPSPVAIPAGEARIFTVTAEGKRLLWDIDSDANHGGPAMIIRP